MSRVLSHDFSRSAPAAGITLACALLLLSVFGIFRFAFLGAGLDPSWAAALVEQTARGASQGRDVVFTGGPLSIVYSRYFHPELGIVAVIFSVLIFLLFIYSTYMIVRNAPSPWSGGVLLVPLLLPMPPTDTFFFILPLLFLLARLFAPPAHRPISSLLFMVAGAGLIAAKFSVIPMVVLAALLLDVDGLLRRRFFPHLAGVFVALFLIHVGTGSRAADFLLYLQMSLDTSSHYADAMSLSGNWRRLALFLAGAMVFAGALAVILLRALRNKAPAFREAALALGLLGALFLSFKAGFVRFDLHELAGWTGLVWVSVLLFAVHPPVRNEGVVDRASAVLAVPVAVGILGMVLALLAGRVPVDGPWTRVRIALDELRYSARAIADPTGWWASLGRGREEGFAAVRGAEPLPAIAGSVDIIASRQAMLIANRTDFDFRPTVQEYTTYSPKTLAANRAFFEGPRAPDNLLLAAGSIDGRYPTSAEGPLWPLFFARYEVKGAAAGQIWMVKRAQPLPDRLGAPRSTTLAFGATLGIDASGPLFMEIDFSKTLLGKLASVAFRPPQIDLVVRLSDGRAVPARVIPDSARGGFLLSPYVESSGDLRLLLNSPETRAALPRVTSVTLATSGIETAFFGAQAKVTLRPLDIPYAPAGTLDVPGIVALALRDKLLDPPRVMVAEEGLFAHAPSSLTIGVGGAVLDLGFGLRKGSHAGPLTTDGACFRVVPTGAAEPLFERCLRPQAVPADQGEQSAQVRIPAGVETLTLETTCAGSCSYDWTYWSRADFR